MQCDDVTWVLIEFGSHCWFPNKKKSLPSKEIMGFQAMARELDLSRSTCVDLWNLEKP